MPQPHQLIVGDCRRAMATMGRHTVDAVITDPPYELGFMGRGWDGAGIAYDLGMWEQALRVTKPGGWLLAFGGTRTWHRMAVAVEDAGWEIRDSIAAWLYGSGFPKSHSVHKATIAAVESTYGSARCTCLDAADGRPDRVRLRRSGGTDAGGAGGAGPVPSPEVGADDVQVIEGGRVGAVRELREGDPAQTTRHPTIEAPLLHEDMRGRRPKASRLGNAEVRPGVEEPASRDSTAGPVVPVMWEDPGAERLGAACAPPRPLPLRRNEPPDQPGGALRPVPPRHRGHHGPGVGVDQGRRDPRRLVSDGDGGRSPAVARVCSWCGLPDAGWLAGLEPLGSALKPAWEPILVARKPFEGTVAENVLAYGTGGLDIGGCRVSTGEDTRRNARGGDNGLNGSGAFRIRERRAEDQPERAGRWPANVVLAHHPGCVDPGPCADGCWVAELDQQSGVSRTPTAVTRGTSASPSSYGLPAQGLIPSYGDEGGASRFFPTFRYQAKAPGSERLRTGEGHAHETVKPLGLMRWLARLVTPPGGVILDPFAGSGTMIEAAHLEGFTTVACERLWRYVDLDRKRAARVGAELEVTSVRRREGALG